MKEINTGLSGREKRWVFSGRTTWVERDGRIHSPMYAEPLFDRGPDLCPNLYADYALFDEHPEAKFVWDKAFPTPAVIDDFDLYIEYAFEKRVHKALIREKPDEKIIVTAHPASEFEDAVHRMFPHDYVFVTF